MLLGWIHKISTLALKVFQCRHFQRPAGTALGTLTDPGPLHRTRGHFLTSAPFDPPLGVRCSEAGSSAHSINTCFEPPSVGIPHHLLHACLVCFRRTNDWERILTPRLSVQTRAPYAFSTGRRHRRSAPFVLPNSPATTDSILSMRRHMPSVCRPEAAQADSERHPVREMSLRVLHIFGGYRTVGLCGLSRRRPSPTGQKPRQSLLAGCMMHLASGQAMDGLALVCLLVRFLTDSGAQLSSFGHFFKFGCSCAFDLL